MRLIGYARVSTAEQNANGHGLDAQEAAIRDHVGRSDGLELLAILSEQGSGRTTARRPRLAEAIERCESGEADGIIVAKLDRLTRSVVDGSRLLRRAEDRGWTLLALDLGIDTSTRNGRLMATVIMALGEWEADAIAERTREGMAAAREKGVKLGRPRVIPQDVVDAATLLAREGLSQTAIARELNERGAARPSGKPWNQQRVSDLLNRYSGPQAR